MQLAHVYRCAVACVPQQLTAAAVTAPGKAGDEDAEGPVAYYIFVIH
jgi:hypothetical protein